MCIKYACSQYKMLDYHHRFSRILQNLRVPCVVSPFSPFSPMGPGKPRAPAYPFSPFIPAVPLFPSNPGFPVGPIKPTNPFSPSQPFEPFNPSSPRIPVRPGCPGKPCIVVMIGHWCVKFEVYCIRYVQFQFLRCTISWIDNWGGCLGSAVVGFSL